MFTTRGKMKRLGNTFEKICSVYVLKEAHNRASAGRSWYREVKEVNASLDHYILKLKEDLEKGRFKTGQYRIRTITDRGKERTIYVLPYYPDRIVHHAVMIVCGNKWEQSLIRDTYQSLPRRGTSDAFERVKKHLRKEKPSHYLQMDVRKYYPSINNNILKQKIRKYLKCKPTLSLLDEIIDSSEGIPIGNYLSQIFGNLYLSEFDWWVKQTLKIKGYFRYCDDLVITGSCKRELHHLRILCEEELTKIGLEIKPTWKVSDFEKTGLDFVGIVFRTHSIRLRKKIRDNFCRSQDPKAIAAYFGWILKLPDKSLWGHKMLHSEEQLAKTMAFISKGKI